MQKPRLEVTITGYLNDYDPTPGVGGYEGCKTVQECVDLDGTNDPMELLALLTGLTVGVRLVDYGNTPHLDDLAHDGLRAHSHIIPEEVS